MFCVIVMLEDQSMIHLQDGKKQSRGREGGSHPRLYSTWPHRLAPQYGEVVLYLYGPQGIVFISVLDCGVGLLYVILSIFLPLKMAGQVYAKELNLASSSRLRKVDGHFICLPFLTNRTSSCQLLAKLLAEGLVAHSSLVQLHNFVPDVL